MLLLLTGDTESEHSFIFPHQPLEQSALSCSGRAAQNYRPRSCHRSVKESKHVAKGGPIVVERCGGVWFMAGWCR